MQKEICQDERAVDEQSGSKDAAKIRMRKETKIDRHQVHKKRTCMHIDKWRQDKEKI